MVTDTKPAAASIAETLYFRAIADAMRTEPADWQWEGKWMSQRHYGITEKRARELQARHGGEARKM